MPVGLFEKILSMSLCSCYAILVVLLMRLLLQKCERKYSFLLWFVVFLNLCLPISIEGPFSLIPNAWMEWTNGFGKGDETVLQGSISTEEEQFAGSGQEQPSKQIEIHYVEMDWNADTVDASQKQQVYEELPADLEKDNLQESSVADTEKETTEDVLAEVTPLTGNRLSLPSKQEAATFIWLTVIAVIGGVSLFRGLALSRKLKKSRADKEVSAEGIVCTKDVDVPFLWGIWNPMIYLPESMEEAEKSYIIAHESYHRKRRDHITKPMVFVIVLVHWFNPLVWLAYALFVRDMEISCDEAVLSHAKEDIKKQYASSLLKYAARQNGFVLSPLTFGEPSLKSRIQNVLCYKKKGIVLTVIAVCVVGLTSCGLILRPESGQVEPPAIIDLPEDVKEPENVPAPTLKPKATNAPVQEALLPQYLHYPSYLYEILCYRETGVMSKNLKRDEGVLHSYADDYAAASASAPAYAAKRDIFLEDGALCNIKWLKLGDDFTLEKLTFDLSDRFAEEGLSQGSLVDIFYDEEWNKVFLLVNAFTMPEEEAEKPYKEITWLLEFAPESPNNYSIEKYETTGAWFGECVRVGDSIFLHGGAGSVPFEIDLVTKEGRSCQQEYDSAKQMVEDFSKTYEAEHDVSVGIHWFSATAQYENVTIFTGIVQDDMDTPILATIYLARQNGEIVPAMLIDEETGEITLDSNAATTIVQSIGMSQVPAELEENTEWMQRIWEISNENGGNARDFGWENSVLPVFYEMTGNEEDVYEDNGEVSIDTDYTLECWMKLQDGTLLENLSFDLKQEMEAHTWTKAFVNGVFYREDLGQVYIALPVMDKSGGILIIDFPKNAPGEYEVHIYEGMSVWFGECVMVGEDICFHAANGSCPWRVNTESWEIYHTVEEFAQTKTIAEAYCKQLAEQNGKQYSLQWFYASGCIDGVEIYTGYIGDDVSTTEAIIYTGFKDGEWQGSTIVQEQTVEATGGEQLSQKPKMVSLRAVNEQGYDTILEVNGYEYYFKLDMDATRMQLEMGETQKEKRYYGMVQVTPVYVADVARKEQLGVLRGTTIFETASDLLVQPQYAEGERLCGKARVLEDGSIAFYQAEEVDRDTYKEYINISEEANNYELGENAEFIMLDANFRNTSVTYERFLEHLSRSEDTIYYITLQENQVVQVWQPYIP
ncbi:MAG: M56 family metallopeptidase [Lachnospiraceae bacterium]|nr:M56 family metallopeptidase [Lachnospiraceae bacterium]